MRYSARFSVVIPLYNKAQSIQQTLNSVLEQRFPAEEIIVIDDGSTDDSVRKVLELGSDKITLIQQSNAGVSAARNVGVSHTNCDFIAFLDGDDVWSPFYLEKMNALIKRFPNSKFFAANYQKMLGEDEFANPKVSMPHIRPEGGVLDGYFESVGNGDLPFMTSSSIITRSLFDDIGGFPLDESMGEDQALFAEAALRTTIAYMPMVLLNYRTDSENRACDTHVPKTMLPFARRLLSKLDTYPSSLRADIKRYCGAHMCFLAKQQLQKGLVDNAAQLLKHQVCKTKPKHWAILSLWCWALKLKRSV